MKYLTLTVAVLLSFGAAADELDILTSSETLSDSSMVEARGGQYELNIDYMQADSDMYGDVIGNGAYGNTTGNNIIDGGSFDGASGVISVVQNSAPNVLIQNSTVINLTLK
ncbi:carbon storage regulator [Photobacterium sp. CCB-ST2H9]|uniref:carbon storage regulator n=1 Tax=unclassified Photobacterium TaxID=2628852 RepID=UPI0020034604|nr:carbon storage regulator [Photobacterium sp. CCB-ST2H9]UTM59127.1 carbon storage regulator [Photobacterium sp. CCB-ST2H9]